MTNNEVFIHVGLQKTGTTWIQEQVFKHMREVSLFRYFDVLTPVPSGKVVLSMEWLCGTSYWPHIPFENRYATAQRLSRMYPHAKAIVGFRDSKSWVRSTYSQYVKNGGVLCFDRWYDELFDERYLNFDEYEKELRECFDEVFVYWFDELKGDKQRFVERLCRFMDVAVPVYEDRVYNQRFSDKKLRAMRWMNQWFYYYPTNTEGRLPGFCGHVFRTVVKKVSGSWQ